MIFSKKFFYFFPEVITHFRLRENIEKISSGFNDVNGGTGCATCTILVALTEQLSIVYNQTIEKSLEKLCNFLPKDSIFKVTCLQAIDQFGPTIIDG